MEINVREPFFSQIVSGEKTVEGRVARGKFLGVKVGDEFIVRCGEKFCQKRVIGMYVYENFREMLNVHCSEAGFPDVESGVECYRGIYGEVSGVIAFELGS